MACRESFYMVRAIAMNAVACLGVYFLLQQQGSGMPRVRCAMQGTAIDVWLDGVGVAVVWTVITLFHTIRLTVNSTRFMARDGKAVGKLLSVA